MDGMTTSAVENVTEAATPTSGRPRPRRVDVGGAVVCGAAALLVLLVLLAPVLAAASPTTAVGLARSAPTLAHPFGIDHLGRDVLSRTLWGGRLTLLMAALSTLLAAVVGVPIGLFAGYVGGIRGGISMRVMDVLLAFPGLLLALIIITIGGTGVPSTILAVGVSFIPVFARVVYGSTQRIRSEEYIAASIVVGASPLRVMMRNVLPVVLVEVVVLVSSAIGWTTLLTAALNFLGFGVAPPTPEWGADLGAGTQYLDQAWWISAAPGLAITLTILIANFLGDFFAKRLSAPRADLQPSTEPVA
ncbi:ABC transporter permease [Curtobacterium sp. MCBD17_019]|nr:ABC transporter permease [Curtobacterium sp. MCBD17_028]PZE73466.1 ABC transporter permease [Curtobacterium sp. MCBD17_019]